MGLWGSLIARVRVRRGRQALPVAVHGGVAVAAAGVVLEAAGRVARPRRLQREETGGGGGRPRRVGASARRSNGRDGREGVGGRRCRWPATGSRAGRWEMVIRVDLHLPKVPGTSL